ncbi:UbiA family prenyltransferase [Microbacterium sp. NPDC076911]|uniref:UbiA family prenyltransferase n=1 Tax=Microbacterium sp. NPDC076911 TaxID=3154958 RepID=UPI0034371B38
MIVLRALWGSTHPGPTLVVTALAVALGIASGLDPWRVWVLAAAVFAGQVSVGISNDALDVVRDRIVSRPDKPIARGDISERGAWAAAFIALGVALLLSALLGVGMLAAHALALASAWAYNAGMKATRASILPFLVSFGLLPSLATLSAVSPSFAPAWATFAGAALGAAVHLTNVLPDLDDDERTGVRGLPHQLGSRLSTVLAVVAVIAGAIAVLIGPAHSDLAAVPTVSWLLFTAAVSVAIITLLQAFRRTPSRTLFRLVMLASLLLATQLIASGAALAS